MLPKASRSAWKSLLCVCFVFVCLLVCLFVVVIVAVVVFVVVVVGGVFLVFVVVEAGVFILFFVPVAVAAVSVVMVHIWMCRFFFLCSCCRCCLLTETYVFLLHTILRPHLTSSFYNCSAKVGANQSHCFRDETFLLHKLVMSVMTTSWHWHRQSLQINAKSLLLSSNLGFRTQIRTAFLVIWPSMLRDQTASKDAKHWNIVRRHLLCR